MVCCRPLLKTISSKGTKDTRYAQLRYFFARCFHVEGTVMVRFGILGAGNIAHRFSASLAHVDDAELVAVSRRTADKAQAFLDEVPHGDGARAYGSHDELLQDPEVDAIYLALPHALHHEWAIKALRVHKAVICEKPATIGSEQMADIARVAREEGVLFMEAMKPRFVPLYAKVVESVGQIGSVTDVEATLCNDMLGFVDGSNSYHMTPGPGAGALLDCGIYCASWLEDFCEGSPSLKSIAGSSRDGIDVYVDARLAIGDVNARLETAFDRGKPRTATIRGTKGSVLVEELHRPTRAVLTLEGSEPQVIEAPYEVDDFFGEISHFVRLVTEGALESPLMTLDDSIRCASLLDVIRPSFTLAPEALDVLREQERILRWPAGSTFGAKEALELGTAVANLAEDYDLGYVVRITREADGYELFGWGADGKKPSNYEYADGKRRAALRLGHCSLWGWTEATLEGAGQEALFSHADMPVAGAFPIRVGNEWVATLAVSGLHEGLDHELLVRGLEHVLKVKAPTYTYVTI